MSLSSGGSGGGGGTQGGGGVILTPPPFYKTKTLFDAQIYHGTDMTGTLLNKLRGLQNK